MRFACISSGPGLAATKDFLLSVAVADRIDSAFLAQSARMALQASWTEAPSE